MTGRRLYDHYVNALRKNARVVRDPETGDWQPTTDPRLAPAWPFLPTRSQALWSDMARAIRDESLGIAPKRWSS